MSTTAAQTADDAGATPDEGPLLSVRDLRKHFPVHGKGVLQRVVGMVKAVDGVSFDLARGEMLGLVGESGSGKTTTARAILRAIQPTSGQVLFRTNDQAVDLAQLPEKHLKPLRTRMQMIFQDPFSSLNPRMTVGDIVGEPLVIHKLASGRELKERVREMLRRVGLAPEHAVRYPHAFSGGQRQRIGIARALILEPSLVIADEPVSALDVSVQAQVINLLAELKDEFHLTCLFVAHDLSVVRHICDRVAVMYAGKIVELAPANRIFDDPHHPYTQALVAAVPYPDPDKPMEFHLGGEVADPSNLPRGCRFQPRCALRDERCPMTEPDLIRTEPDRWVACHRCEA